ncbi:EXPH5 protein, partial [Bucco capensis]|nr:EXPH5 protein [Bucco capensis]
QAEMCNSPVAAEAKAHSFDANQKEMMERRTEEWSEQLEKEFFSVLNDLDDQLAQEQAQEPLDRTVSTSSASSVHYRPGFSPSRRQSASRGQHRNAWSDLPGTLVPDGLRTIRAQEEHKLFIRPRKLHKGSLYPPSIAHSSGFRHRSCLSRDTAGRSYSVCSLQRCSSAVSSEQLSAARLQHPLARESSNAFVPRLGRQNPKRTPLSSIVWNNSPDSPGPAQDTMFRTQSMMDFHAPEHGGYPGSFQEAKYTCYHSKQHSRRSGSSRNCFSRVSCPDKAPSPLPFDNWENYPFYTSENNLSRSYYRDTSHGKLYANKPTPPYGIQDSYPSWADLPQHCSEEAFLPSAASFEVIMANLAEQQWGHTKNANSKDSSGQFTASSQQNVSLSLPSFDGDPETSKHSLSYFCLEKASRTRSSSPGTARPPKQDSLLKPRSSCSIPGSPSRSSLSSPDSLVLYYTLPRKSASIAGSALSETPISLPGDRRTTQDKPEDADLPGPRENAQSPRTQTKENEAQGSPANVFFPSTLEKEVHSCSSEQVSAALVTPQSEENPLPSPSSEEMCASESGNTRSQPISAISPIPGPLNENRKAGSGACSPPLPLVTDTNSNTYANSCLQADPCPEHSLTAQTVLAQCQSSSHPASLTNANLQSCQWHKSCAKSQPEHHLSEGLSAPDARETFASGSNHLPEDGIHGKRLKSYSELVSCDENENWASDDERCSSPRNLLYPSVEFGIFGKEQQLAFLENIKRSLTEGRLWRPCLLNNPAGLRDGEPVSISRAELLSSSSAGSKMSSAASSPREEPRGCPEEPAAYSDSDSDTTTDDEYYLDETDKESEL